MSVKPLHVRVAEALGWKRTGNCPLYGDGTECYGRGTFPDGTHECVKKYDSDWAATGPLLQKFNIAVGPVFYYGGDNDGQPTGEWYAGRAEVQTGRGPDPLAAICDIIIHLGEQGRLHG